MFDIWVGESMIVRIRIDVIKDFFFGFLNYLVEFYYFYVVSFRILCEYKL